MEVEHTESEHAENDTTEGQDVEATDAEDQYATSQGFESQHSDAEAQYNETPMYHSDVEGDVAISQNEKVQHTASGSVQTQSHAGLNAPGISAEHIFENVGEAHNPAGNRNATTSSQQPNVDHGAPSAGIQQDAAIVIGSSVSSSLDDLSSYYTIAGHGDTHHPIAGHGDSHHPIAGHGDTQQIEEADERAVVEGKAVESPNSPDASVIHIHKARTINNWLADQQEYDPTVQFPGRTEVTSQGVQANRETLSSPSAIPSPPSPFHSADATGKRTFLRKVRVIPSQNLATQVPDPSVATSLQSGDVKVFVAMWIEKSVNEMPEAIVDRKVDAFLHIPLKDVHTVLLDRFADKADELKDTIAALQKQYDAMPKPKPEHPYPFGRRAEFFTESLQGSDNEGDDAAPDPTPLKRSRLNYSSARPHRRSDDPSTQEATRIIRGIDYQLKKETARRDPTYCFDPAALPSYRVSRLRGRLRKGLLELEKTRRAETERRAEALAEVAAVQRRDSLMNRIQARMVEEKVIENNHQLQQMEIQQDKDLVDTVLNEMLTESMSQGRIPINVSVDEIYAVLNEVRAEEKRKAEEEAARDAASRACEAAGETEAQDVNMGGQDSGPNAAPQTPARPPQAGNAATADAGMLRQGWGLANSIRNTLTNSIGRLTGRRMARPASSPTVLGKRVRTATGAEKYMKPTALQHDFAHNILNEFEDHVGSLVQSRVNDEVQKREAAWRAREAQIAANERQERERAEEAQRRATEVQRRVAEAERLAAKRARETERLRAEEARQAWQRARGPFGTHPGATYGLDDTFNRHADSRSAAPSAGASGAGAAAAGANTAAAGRGPAQAQGRTSMPGAWESSPLNPNATSPRPLPPGEAELKFGHILREGAPWAPRPYREIPRPREGTRPAQWIPPPGVNRPADGPMLPFGSNLLSKPGSLKTLVIDKTNRGDLFGIRSGKGQGEASAQDGSSGAQRKPDEPTRSNIFSQSSTAPPQPSTSDSPQKSTQVARPEAANNDADRKPRRKTVQFAKKLVEDEPQQPAKPLPSSQYTPRKPSGLRQATSAPKSAPPRAVSSGTFAVPSDDSSDESVVEKEPEMETDPAVETESDDDTAEKIAEQFARGINLPTLDVPEMAKNGDDDVLTGWFAWQVESMGTPDFGVPMGS